MEPHVRDGAYEFVKSGLWDDERVKLTLKTSKGKEGRYLQDLHFEGDDGQTPYREQSFLVFSIQGISRIAICIGGKRLGDSGSLLIFI